jgi:hypothetical protein
MVKNKNTSGKRLKPIKGSGFIAKDELVKDASAIYNYYYNYISELNSSQAFTILQKS